MEILQLKYFCHSALTENFSETARRFGVPPSDISQSVKRLEAELGVRLFDRHANSIFLSEQGKFFYEKASQALTILDEGKAKLRNDRKTEKIRICVNSNRRIVMQTVEKFRREYPCVEIAVKYGSDSKGDFDYIVTCDVSKKERMAEQLLVEDLLLAVNAEDRLAKAERIDVKNLACENFVSMSEGSNLNLMTKRIGADFGFEPKIVIQSDDPFYIRKCVEIGLGIAVVPSISWRGQFSENIVLKPLGYKRSCYLIKKENTLFSYVAQSFAQMLREECRREEEQQSF